MQLAGSTKKWVGIAAAAAALFASAAAHANLVSNGGFETGDFSGWVANTTTNDGVDGLSPHDGSKAAYFGTYTGTASITQTLDTYGPGGVYDVSFWIKNEGDGPNSFEFDWDGAQVMALVDVAAFDYVQYSFVLVSTGAWTDLKFTFNHSPAFWDFDSVVVENHIPEPGSFALAGLAGALALSARRRRPATA